MNSSSLPTQDLLLDQIVEDPHQPRQTFNAEALDSFALELWRGGLLHPITVDPTSEEDRYLLTAGARRYRAFGLNRNRAADLLAADPNLPPLHPARRYEAWTVIPAAINTRKLPAWERTLLQLSENTDREDLTLLELSHAYAAAQAQSGLSKAQFAARAGFGETKLHSYLFVTKTKGTTREAIEKLVLREPDAVRLFDNLPEPHKTALLQDAIANERPISRPVLRKLHADLDSAKKLDKKGGQPKLSARPSLPETPTPRDVLPSAPRLLITTVQWLQERMDVLASALAGAQTDEDVHHLDCLRRTLDEVLSSATPYLAILEASPEAQRS